MRHSLPILARALTLGSGCQAEDLPTIGGPIPPGTHLVVTTTDFATGAVSVVDADAGTVRADLALASTDAIPFAHDGLVYVVNRFMYDYVDVLDPADGLSLLAQHPIEVAGVTSSNPHALAFDPQGRAWVCMYGAPELQIHDFGRPVGESVLGRVDLSELADADGTTEVVHVIPFGNLMWIVVAQLDQNASFERVGPDRLFAVDTNDESLLDLDPELDGIQGLELPGEFHRQWRRDPDDPGGIYLLSTGILRVDLDQVEASWIVPPESFEAAGIDTRFLAQSFDVTLEQGFVVSAYAPDFSEVRLYRARPGESPTQIAAGFDSAERTVEVLHGTVWYGDARIGDSGLRRFDLDGTPIGDVLSVGLPPYSMTMLELSE